MRLLIAGSRSFNDFSFLEKEVLKFLKENRKNGEKIEIISGRARGADELGEKFAEKYNLDIIKKPADWNRYGKGAGHIRNKEMAGIATHAILFWDGHSPGTKNMKKLLNNSPGEHPLIMSCILFKP